ncbi:protein SGT1 homolog isoform X2 [Amblyraja radiata]|uniref:protein SGT1 homolog isoform X2 n=1 Tax=Amblyraja radiata TaxID=386614 RepID=UPI0014037C3E|nr:protein SGT1 homolog isoform X2 [Amblyraja radiata]
MADERVFTDECVAECPEKAVEALNAAVELDLNVAENYCQRAYAHILLRNYKEVVKDASKALELKPNYALAHLRKGIAEYHLKMYQSSLESFTRGHELDAENDSFSSWIKTCKGHLESTGQQDGNNEEETHKHQMTARQIKHDWYQTDSHIIITIMIKNANKDDVKVEFAEKSIELKMKKTEAMRWEKLEGVAPDVKYFMPEQPQPYPSSSQNTKNWDKLVTEIKKEENDEKPEGDAALNQLFQKIYADGSDEVKRAMNKSFTESGGTVLSTNWTEVGTKPVAVNPPDDMEWKKL